MIAEKEVVYQRFPIPLINRLEKHFLVVSTGLTSDQARLVSELETWVRRFSDAKPEYSRERYQHNNVTYEIHLTYDHLVRFSLNSVVLACMSEGQPYQSELEENL